MHIVFIANIISLLTLGTQVMAYGKCRDSSATKTDVGFGAIYDATAAHWVGKTYPNDYADQAAVCSHDLKPEINAPELRESHRLDSLTTGPRDYQRDVQHDARMYGCLLVYF